MDNKTPIVVALIGLMGTVTVALITNWHSIFPPRPVGPPADRTIVTPGGGGDATGSAAVTPQPVIPSPSPAGTIVPAGPSTSTVHRIAGQWADMDDDYRYAFSQTGGAVAYRASEKGADRGGGEGTIIGRALHYGFTSDGGPGSCTATLADDGDHIVGTCTRGSETFPVRLRRVVVLTDPKTLFGDHRP